MDIYQAISELLKSGARGALATVVGATGSTPGKEGAKMLIREDGTTFGTIGGGCTEASVWALARDVLATERPLRESFKLSPKQAGEEGLACGGTVEIFIEPLGRPVVVLLGAGHIAQSVAKLAAMVDMDVQVIDDREQFANEERFPGAAETLVSDFETCFEKLVVTPRSYIVIVTRGHRYDQLALAKAVATPASFIGLIGSKIKIAHIFHNLKKAGVDEERLAHVRAPIGLDIGARSPEEIALSIVAQLVAHRRRSYLKGAQGAPGRGAPAAAATAAESSPVAPPG